MWKKGRGGWRVVGTEVVSRTRSFSVHSVSTRVMTNEGIRAKTPHDACGLYGKRTTTKIGMYVDVCGLVGEKHVTEQTTAGVD